MKKEMVASSRNVVANVGDESRRLARQSIVDQIDKANRDKQELITLKKGHEATLASIEAEKRDAINDMYRKKLSRFESEIRRNEIESDYNKKKAEARRSIIALGPPVGVGCQGGESRGKSRPVVLRLMD